MLLFSTHRDFRRVKICVVNSAAGKVSPAGRQPLFDGLERNVEVQDRVHAEGVLQSFSLRYRPGETCHVMVMELKSENRSRLGLKIHTNASRAAAEGTVPHPNLIIKHMNSCLPTLCAAVKASSFPACLLSSVCFTGEDCSALVYIPQPRARGHFLANVTQPSPAVLSIHLYLSL